MAKGRYLLKSLSTSRRYAALHATAPTIADFAQALYPLLIAHADDDGCLPGDAWTIKHTVCPASPHSDADVAAALDALVAVALLERVDAASMRVTNFAARQQVGRSPESPSSLPPPVPPSLSSPQVGVRTGPFSHGEEKTATRSGVGGTGGEGSSWRSGTRLLRGARPWCAFDGPRVYVPQRLHAEFIGLLNRPDAERELLTWYGTVSDEWTSGAHAQSTTGADMFTFWRERFNERWPVTLAPRATRPKDKPSWAK